MLKIKDEIDLKELEKFGFKKYVRSSPTWRSSWSKEKEKYIGETYTEIGYELDNGTNIVCVTEQWINNDWRQPNEEREIYVFESDYEMGVSKKMLETIYDLIQAGLVEKVEDK